MLLENGGNDPLVVDADVDPAWAAAQAALGGFINSGQLCTSVERVHVHEAVAEEFLAALVAEAEALVLGPGHGPRDHARPAGRRASPGRRARAGRGRRVEAGARVLTGGEVPAGPGAFYPATVLTDVRPDMAVMAEETFGPVVPVMTGRLVRGGAARPPPASPYGLAATVLTGSMANAQEAWRRLPGRHRQGERRLRRGPRRRGPAARRQRRRVRLRARAARRADPHQGRAPGPAGAQGGAQR